jgi:hypothetical protein
MVQTHTLAKFIPNRARFGRKRGRLRRSKNLGPTPETAAKLDPDVLLAMLEKDQITSEQEAAARDLFSMWRALQRGMLPQMKLGVAGPMSGRKQSRSPFACMGDSEIECGPRAISLGRRSRKRHCGRAPRLSRLDFARRVIENNVSPADVARDFRAPTESILSGLRNALDCYCSFKRVKKQLT